MALFDWLRRPVRVTELAAIVPGRVEIEGVVEALATLPHPVTGEECVALEYHASPPSSLSVHGVPHASRAFTVSAIQARDFVVCDGVSRVIVEVGDEQDDVERMHGHLSEQHGLRLRVEIAAIRPGTRVRVIGKAVLGVVGPAYRSFDYVASIAAERFWELRADE
jgi:hypothetical protein